MATTNEEEMAITLALRKAIVAQEHIMSHIRQFARIRNELRKDNTYNEKYTKSEQDAIENMVDVFLQNNADRIDNDERAKIQKFAWNIVEEAFDKIAIPINDYVLENNPETKRIHHHTIKRILKELEKKHGISSDHLKDAQLDDMLNSNIEDYWIPITKIRSEGKKLHEAMRNHINGEALTEEQKILLTENAEIVTKWEIFLFSIGMEVLTTPASSLWIDGQNGAEHLALWQENRENNNIKIATEELNRAKKAANSLVNIIKESGFEFNEVQIDRKKLEQIKSFLSTFDEAIRSWKSQYDKNWELDNEITIVKIIDKYRNAHGFTEGESTVVDNIKIVFPLPLLGDKTISVMRENLNQAISAIDKKIGSADSAKFAPNSPEFIDLYSALTDIVGRVEMLEYRVKQVDRLTKENKGKNEKFNNLLDEINKMAQTLLIGYNSTPEKPFRTSPAAIRNLAIQNLYILCGEFDDMDKAVIDFHLMIEPYEILSQYASKMLAEIDGKSGFADRIAAGKKASNTPQTAI